MKNQKKYFLTLATLLLTTLLGATKISQAAGGLSLSQTRVIFDANSKNEKVTLNNHSDKVYLVNSRVLSAPDSNSSVTEAMPFIVTPPLFRLEKDSRNTVLISKNDTSMLPKDRESLFYLSFLAIPSVKKNDGGENGKESAMTTTQVSFGIRSVIKLFYRPSDLPMPAQIAPEKLTFEQRGSQLTVNNPTPYHITLAKLTIDGQQINIRKQGPMIAPQSFHTYQLNDAKKVSDIQWTVINELGGVSAQFSWQR